MGIKADTEFQLHVISDSLHFSSYTVKKKKSILVDVDLILTEGYDLYV